MALGLLTICGPKVDLTKNIANILEELQDEVSYAVKTHIGDLPGKDNFSHTSRYSWRFLTLAEWTSIPLYHMLSHLVGLLSSRIFVGYPLNRNETWVRLSSSVA